MQATEKWSLLARLQLAPRCIFSKSPCISKENVLLETGSPGTGSSPQIVAELERLLNAATGQEATSASGTKSESALATISADLWRQLKPGSLVLAAGFDKNDNLIGWWGAIIVRVDDGELLVRWRDDPNEPRVSRSHEYIALLHPGLTGL
jgi:hypothetical protein